MRLFLTRLAYLILLFWATLMMPLFAQEGFKFQGNKSREVINFKKSRGLIVLPMYINDKGPFNFILDTGVGSVIITNPSLKDSLNLQFLRKIEISGLGEQQEIIAYSTPFLKLKIGSTINQSTAAAILASDVFNLSGYAGLPIDGLIGYDFFSSFIIQVNYESGLLKVFNHRKSRLVRKGYRLPIQLINKKPYVNAMVETDDHQKLPLKLLIDTGSGHSISLESNDNNAFPLPQKFVIANLGVGLAGNIRGFQGRIKQLKLGKFHFDNMVASFPYYDDIAAKIANVERNGSLGNTLFRKFNVLFDYEHSQIFLKPLSSYKEPFEYDMSGMELVAGGEKFNRYLVARVESQSAADDFGIIPGDEILAINFNPVSKLSFEEILRLLSSKEGRTLFVEVGRGGDSFAGVLTLKRRI